MRTTILTMFAVAAVCALVGVIAAPADAHNNQWESKPCQEKQGPSSPTSPPSEPQPQTPSTPGAPTSPSVPGAPTTTPGPVAPAPTPASPTQPPSTDSQTPCEVCQSRRRFTIRLALRSSKNVRSARVYYTGHTRHGVKLHKRKRDGRWVARISFYGHRYFPGQQEVIAIRVRYRDGRRRGDFRLYRPCQGKLGFLNEPWRV